MEFEYNGNLVFEDRVELVSNEIIKKYPEVDKESARKVAALESPISTEVDDEMYVRRLYLLALVYQYDREMKEKFISEIINYYKDKIGSNEKIDNLIPLLVDSLCYGASLPEFD